MENREPYLGALQWQLIELGDFSKMAVSMCHYARELDRNRLIEISRILHDQFNVSIIRTLRPRGKRLPRSQMITEGPFKGFFDVYLPEDVPEIDSGE